MKKIKKDVNKNGQIWVETVIYTLIGLILIGVILAFATPAIQKYKDKSTITASINSMNALDNNILDVKRGGIANVRNIDFLISKGKLLIDSEKDQITFEITGSKYAYSEPGDKISLTGSDLEIITKEQSGKYDVILTLDYLKNNKANITFEGKDSIEIREFNPGAVPYNFIIENRGKLPTSTICSPDADPTGCEEKQDCSASGVCFPKATNIDISEL